jgi:hypothetical protein
MLSNVMYTGDASLDLEGVASDGDDGPPQALAAGTRRRRHSPFRLPHAKNSGPQGGVKLAGGLNNFWQSSNLAVQNGFISRSGG